MSRRNLLRLLAPPVFLVATLAPAHSARADTNPQFFWPYADTSTSTIHHDPYNSDYSPNDPAAEYVPAWTALEGDITFTGQVIDDAHNRVYVTTGKKGQANLWAFNRSGRLMWSSDNWKGPDRLDTCASSSTAIIDADGVVYVGDCRYLWASDHKGRLRWKAPLPVNPDGTRTPFVTAVFTRTGEVGGVTATGRVALYSRTGGALLAQLDLGLAPPPPPVSSLLTECIWRSGDPSDPYLLDPQLIVRYAQGFAGVGAPANNTPAVLPDPVDVDRTRIYAPAILPNQQDVRLFRIDYDAGTKTLAPAPGFDALVPGGMGSATSPDVSPDGARVYMGDNLGVLHAFDADDGHEVWARHLGHMYGSITTAWDSETIYAGADFGLQAVDARTGAILWQRRYDDLAEAMIPPRWPFRRAGLVAGVVSVSPHRLVFPVTLAYKLSDTEELAYWPMKSLVVVLDRRGNLVGRPTELQDVSETGAVVDRRGNLYVTHASAMSSVATCVYGKFGFLKYFLPVPVAPRAGIEVFRPARKGR